MAAKSGASAESLEATAEKKILESLGTLAESLSCRFSCGGELSSPDKIQLVYENKDGELRKVVLPGASDADVQQLLDACTVASFGVNDQLVTDTSYRNAVKLDPEHFATSFHVADTPIQLNAMAMVPNVQGIRAELYKLNIYSAGGFFKAHVDTPRSDQMFGSLVVCLPTQFSGGALATCHHGHEVKFDWSSPLESPRKTLSWAVFFSDVEHEVLPVTQGQRLTLTYNLYSMKQHIDNVIPSYVTVNPLYKELKQAISHPHFMRDGGVLGFASHHRYVYTDLNDTEDLPSLLKGADLLVYMVAKSLGLSVIVKPVVKQHWRRTQILLETFHKIQHNSYFDECENEQFEELFGPGHHVKHISWCQTLDHSQWQAAGFTGHYGNEPSLVAYYQTATILVGIPEWGEERKRSSAIGSIQEISEDEGLEPGEGERPTKRHCASISMPLSDTWQSLVKDLPDSLCDSVHNLPQLMKNKYGKLTVIMIRSIKPKGQEMILKSVLGDQSPLVDALLQRMREQNSCDAVLEKLCFHGEMPEEW